MIEKKNYVKKRIYKEFKVRDHVYIRVKPRKKNLMIEICTKLATLVFGTLEILDKVGLVAYYMDFPNHIKVQNIFYVSLLKKYVHDNSHIID